MTKPTLQRRRKKPAKPTIFIAVVVGADLDPHSKRNRGDYGCFIGNTKTEVIERALAARDAWTASGTYGPYRILTGTLTGEAKQLQRFKEIKL